MYDGKAKPIGANALLSQPQQLFADGLIYINTAQWGFAYAVFSTLCQQKECKSVAAMYNMALCHFFAKEYTKATSLLIEALTQVTPSISHQSNTNLPKGLLEHEYENSQYRSALIETAVALNNSLVKLRIRRLLVDVQLALGNWQEVIRLSALPDMDKCQNVQEALAILKSNT
ncbi:MAG: hypothetical protein REI64_12650 [Pedobacter sp.]|uniref:hypothetical protein n=1 Tax=Pedobacter sp. TaxID=1411316 RepID=UPI0028079A64|nr:hypothetical protein [Pedobacter sp.]MDQ8005645.1 hypothetical protein [Pedobacter sp.]